MCADVFISEDRTGRCDNSLQSAFGDRENDFVPCDIMLFCIIIHKFVYAIRDFEDSYLIGLVLCQIQPPLATVLNDVRKSHLNNITDSHSRVGLYHKTGGNVRMLVECPALSLTDKLDQCCVLVNGQY